MNMQKRKGYERSVARLYAVLALFQHKASDDGLRDVLSDYISKTARVNPKIESIPVRDMHEKFFIDLMKNVSENIEVIDAEISEHLSKDWSMERIDPVLLCILELGVCEILLFSSVPSKVILDEYTEVANAFFTKQNASFINGTLNAIARKKRPGDIFND